MNLKEIAKEINELLEIRRNQIELRFIEDSHIYYMKDNNGKIKKTFPSVSKVIKSFYAPFDANKKSLEMSKGDVEKQKELLAEWKLAGDISTNLGSRVHFELEKHIVEQYGNYKEVRQPIYTCDEDQIKKSDKMIQAGKNFISLMHERGAVLLDTEMVLGDPDLHYVGQPDNVWLMMNKTKTDFGFVVTDHKSGQPKNFKVMPYTGKLYHPFNDYPDNALGKYYIQIPLYGRLITKMLENTKYNTTKMFGGVIALMKEDGTFEEFKVPPYITNTLLTMDLTRYVM